MDAAAVALIVAGFLAGVPTGVWLERQRYLSMPWLKFKQGKQARQPKVYDVHLSQAHTVRLHYIGDLDEAHFKSMCQRILDGEPFTLARFTKPPTRLMSRPQWESIVGELVDRGLAEKPVARRPVKFTLPGMAFLRWGAGRYKRTYRTAHQHTEANDG